VSKELRLYFSKSDSYEDYSEGIKDADAFSLAITTTNDIRWLNATGSLIVGTAGDEWSVGSNKLDAPITPTSFSVEQQSSYGSSVLQSVKANNAVLLFVDYVGRKVRELTCVDNVAKTYTAPDLTALAEHITESGVICSAYQRNPDSILWCVLDDGSLISLVYEREQNVIAWSKHPIGGEVQSVCVIPSTDEDEVWLTISRLINGTSTVFIERMTPRVYGDQEDAFFVDCGITKTYANATTAITGLSWLIGETVAILGDGGVQANQEVSVTGTLTLTTGVLKVTIGIPYTYVLEPMRMDISGAGGTTHGSIMRINEIVVSFLESYGAQYGKDDSSLFDFDWPTNVTYGTAPALFTGDLVASFDGGFDTDDELIITGSNPMPCIIRAIVLRIDKTGR
jgi:hypothetical protein